MSKSKITLSKETIDVMKHLSSININLLIKKGNRLRTMSGMKQILCEIEVEEHFPRDFGIYDLNEFVKVVKSMNEPTLDFSNEDFVVIESGDSTIHYSETSSELITSPPEKFNEPECGIHFPISESTVSSIKKFVKTLSLPEVLITSSGNEEVEIKVTDTKVGEPRRSKHWSRNHRHIDDLERNNQKSNCYSEVLQIERPVGEIQKRMMSHLFNVIPDDYEFYLTSVGVCKLVGSGKTYWIALEPKPEEVSVTNRIPEHLRLDTHWTNDEGIVSFDFESMDKVYGQLKSSLRDLETESLELQQEGEQW
jgi:hypothetical protein